MVMMMMYYKESLFLINLIFLSLSAVTDGYLMHNRYEHIIIDVVIKIYLE